MRVLKAGRLLKRYFPGLCWPVAEVNDKNGSTKLFGFTGKPIAIDRARELGQRIKTKQLSPVELTEAYLERGRTLGARLNAYATLTPDLAAIAWQELGRTVGLTPVTYATTTILRHDLAATPCIAVTLQVASRVGASLGTINIEVLPNE